MTEREAQLRSLHVSAQVLYNDLRAWPDSDTTVDQAYVYAGDLVRELGSLVYEAANQPVEGREGE